MFLSNQKDLYLSPRVSGGRPPAGQGSTSLGLGSLPPHAYPGSGTFGPPPAKLPALCRRKLMGSHHPSRYAFPPMTTDTTRPHHHHHAAQQSWPRKVCLLPLPPPLPTASRVQRTMELTRLRDVTSEISHRLGAPRVHGPDGLLLPVHAAAHVAAHEHAQIRPDRYERHLSLAHDSPALALSLPPSASFLRRPDASTAPSSPSSGHPALRIRNVTPDRAVRRVQVSEHHWGRTAAREREGERAQTSACHNRLLTLDPIPYSTEKGPLPGAKAKRRKQINRTPRYHNKREHF